MSKLTVLGTLIVTLTACYHGDATSQTPVGNTTPKTATAADPGGLVMDDKAIGMLDGNTPATQEALSKKLVGFEVKRMSEKDPPPFKDGNKSAHFEVWKGAEKEYAIIISGDTIFNVHTENAKISVAGHPNWHVGATFQESKQLSRCDCWGKKVVCWKDGEHAALAFDRGCDNLTSGDAHALAVLDGLQITRMVWNPHPFAGDEQPVHGGSEKGGGLSGTVHVHPDDGGGGGDPCGGGGDDDDE
jgi:hypothetical protein